jgi:hypothetical protein
MQPKYRPLLTMALALFGSGSFIAERMARPEAFLAPNLTYEEWQGVPNYDACVEQVPFMSLLHSYDGGIQLGNVLEPCVKNSADRYDDIQRQVTSFVRSLYWNNEDHYDGKRITNAFTAAAFLANEIWLLSRPLMQSWSVRYDAGADTVVPVISNQGIIMISTLLGIYLASIFALALYSAIPSRWTDQLGAFAMLRIGASLSDDIQFRPATETQNIRALDELPGWVGDATDGEGELGQLALGASGPLKSSRKFAAYGS